ncbi:MAG TPA: glycosyltransferase [Leptospiraceae bacterium]|nr:glycosyltransferase [Leptospiraceae bacterium]HMY65514.1 glycosyltransferase [Leptospiraceae bacterium]HNF23878.1 glycosyltransferase [Leptospiraceae bacterium]HNI96058.1 glycosyltransferase [Leptospiraceae bacterium]HNM04920.1 glycosyltransferase [Leptospiraceae bacterium]
MKNILIAAGGTGGHISPGIALAEEICRKKQDFGIDNVFIHSLKRNIDNPDLKDSPCPVLWHSTPQPSVLNAFSILFSALREISVLRKRKITHVIAMGGYSCIPAVLYSVFFRKTVYLCEQNAVSGRLVKMFFRFAEKTAFSYPPENLNLRNRNYRVLGNPLRSRILPEKSAAEKQNEVLQKERLNVLVLGGSQGARQINNMALEVIKLPEIAKVFNFRILTGTGLYEETRKKTVSDVELIDYSQDMRIHYEWADLLIARSGAGVMSEAQVYGIAMILVPYPFASDNHQSANAALMKRISGIWVLEQKDEDIKQLKDILLQIVRNRGLLKDISEKVYASALPHAAQDTAGYFFDEPV